MFKNVILLAVGFLAARWWYVDRKGGDNANIGNIKDNLYNFIGKNFPDTSDQVAEKEVDLILNGNISPNMPASTPVQQAAPAPQQIFSEEAKMDKKTRNAVVSNNVPPNPQMLEDAKRHMGG